ncbi:hypothetical protein [Sulfuricurvum sp.]|uniref:hypothetical protein n=1 Tax=Sulfuricurvum sp. TaxID=2025608 RepID=UPI00356ABCE0
MKIDWKWAISILVAIITALIPFIYSNSFFQKDKELSYEVLQIINKKSFNGIENKNIFFGIKDGKETYLGDNLSVVTIRFINSGKTAIQRSEFDTPITIKIPEAKRIFQSQISYIKPKDLHIEFKQIENSIQLNPMLLNPDDEFTISIILDGVIDKITPTARIVGVHELTQIVHEDKEKNKIKFFLGIFLVIYLAKFLAMVVNQSGGFRSQLWYAPAFILIEYTSIMFTTQNMIFNISLKSSMIMLILIMSVSMFIFHFTDIKNVSTEQ